MCVWVSLQEKSCVTLIKSPPFVHRVNTGYGVPVGTGPYTQLRWYPTKPKPDWDEWSLCHFYYDSLSFTKCIVKWFVTMTYTVSVLCLFLESTGLNCFFDNLSKIGVLWPEFITLNPRLG